MRIPGWLFIVGILALVVGTAICSVGSFAFARQTAISLGNGGVVQVPSFADFLQAQPTATVTPTQAPPTLTPRPGDTPVPTNAPPTATLDPLAQYTYDDPRRINILLMGIDQREGETGTFNTDTMIVFSVDPVRKTVGMLSIPRDLYVEIPGSVPSRINTANAVGEINAYPGGGAALAALTVSQTLGIRVDKFVLINFDVFNSVINLIAPNGVEVCPPETIDDPYYPDGSYGFITVHFEAGCQRLQADALLQYARTRHGNSDFDRSVRQQEVIKAVRDEVLSAGGILNFLSQIPTLYTELADSYKTNLSVDEIMRLAALAQEIPRENIFSGQLGAAQTSPMTVMLNGISSDVLSLNYGAAQAQLQQVFNPPETVSLADLRQRAEAENASIVVFNNTDISGLAGLTRDWLSSRQITVSDLGNIPIPDSALTTVRDYTNKSWTARYLIQLLGLPADRLVPGTDGMTDADVMVVVGPDIQPLLNGE